MTPAANQSCLIMPSHRALRRAGELLLISALCAIGVGWAVPLETDPHEVSLSELRADPGFSEILWVDARSRAAYQAAHRDGAILVNEEDWEGGLVRFMEVWEPGLRVVVYCDDRACQTSGAVAERLRTELGITDVFALENGWAALKSRSIPP